MSMVTNGLGGNSQELILGQSGQPTNASTGVYETVDFTVSASTVTTNDITIIETVTDDVELTQSETSVDLNSFIAISGSDYGAEYASQFVTNMFDVVPLTGYPNVGVAGDANYSVRDVTINESATGLGNTVIQVSGPSVIRYQFRDFTGTGNVRFTLYVVDDVTHAASGETFDVTLPCDSIEIISKVFEFLSPAKSYTASLSVNSMDGGPITASYVPAMGTYDNHLIPEHTVAPDAKPYKFAYEQLTVDEQAAFANVGGVYTTTTPHDNIDLLPTAIIATTNPVIISGDDAIDFGVFNVSTDFGDIDVVEAVTETLTSVDLALGSNDITLLEAIHDSVAITSEDIAVAGNPISILSDEFISFDTTQVIATFNDIDVSEQGAINIEALAANIETHEFSVLELIEFVSAVDISTEANEIALLQESDVLLEPENITMTANEIGVSIAEQVELSPAITTVTMQGFDILNLVAIQLDPISVGVDMKSVYTANMSQIDIHKYEFYEVSAGVIKQRKSIRRKIVRL